MTLLLNQHTEVIFALRVPHPPFLTLACRLRLDDSPFFFPPCSLSGSLTHDQSSSYCTATMIRKSRVWEEDSV